MSNKNKIIELLSRNSLSKIFKTLRVLNPIVPLSINRRRSLHRGNENYIQIVDREIQQLRTAPKLSNTQAPKDTSIKEARLAKVQEQTNRILYNQGPKQGEILIHQLQNNFEMPEISECREWLERLDHMNLGEVKPVLEEMRRVVYWKLGSKQISQRFLQEEAELLEVRILQKKYEYFPMHHNMATQFQVDNIISKLQKHGVDKSAPERYYQWVLRAAEIQQGIGRPDYAELEYVKILRLEEAASKSPVLTALVDAAVHKLSRMLAQNNNQFELKHYKKKMSSRKYKKVFSDALKSLEDKADI